MSPSERFPRVKTLPGPDALRRRLRDLGADLPVDDEPMAAPRSPLAAPLPLPHPLPAAVNRFVVQPMEGWDGTEDGAPSDLTVRRWQRFGASGAGLVWGGEAVAVRHDGRANPNQLVMTPETAPPIAALRADLLDAARAAGHEDPVVGLQLTHSGRWSRPTATGRAPRVAFRHPVLDRRSEVTDAAAVLTDEEVTSLIADFAAAAALARDAGFDFVDVKHCHGYLLHEFLGARTRTGRYGGPTLDDRTRLLHDLIEAVQAAAPGLTLGVRLSVFDAVPAGDDVAPAAPDEPLSLDEPIELIRGLVRRGVRMVNVTAASPYYSPHLQRPAAFPPSDGYDPPEDPLVGVARLLQAARTVKAAVPEAVVVSSGWSYLQEFVPNVAQACVRDGWFDAVGLGRMMLPYPDLAADVLAGRPPATDRLCRTFSDCTTAPRNGLVSGCYPLDPFYKARPERKVLLRVKRGVRAGRG